MAIPWQSVLDEPRAAVEAEPTRWDWVIAAAVVASATFEAAARPDVSAPLLGWAMTVGLVPALFFRRRHPFAVVALAFSVSTLVEIVLLLTESPPIEMISSVWFLLLPYAVCRWGSGREAAAGLAFILVGVVAGLVVGWTGVGDAIGGTAVLLSSVALGVAVRTQHGARERRLEQAKADERVLIARELHDTVAHHVSAIAIQAQAGRALAARDPASSVRALEVIEQEASRTLAEMRSIVGVLRSQSPAEYAPQPGVGDVHRLARDGSTGPEVRVLLSGDLDGLATAVDAAVYRIAQEAVTNAVRHARGATYVDVCVEGHDASVSVVVRDDGEVAPGPTPGQGFGITGMVERATLLGGTCRVGPLPEGGWSVEATLPRAGER